MLRGGLRVILMSIIIFIMGIAFIFFAIFTNPRDTFRSQSPTLVVKSGFFIDSECLNACWQGLRPGITTTNQIDNFFKDRFSTKLKIKRYSDEFIVYSAEYAEQRSVDVSVKNDQAFKIYVVGYNDLTLEKIVETLGSPQSMRLGYLKNPVGGLNTALEIYYPGQGFVFALNSSTGIDAAKTNESKVSICLNRQAGISFAYVLIPGTIQSIIANMSLPYEKLSDERIDAIIDQLRPWTGFSCVQLD